MAVQPIRNEEGATLAHMIVAVHGKVLRRRRHEGTFFTAVIAPAPDAYSKPQTVEFRSKQSFGEVGEIVTVACRVGGYERKQYETRPNADGLVTKITPVDITLDAVED